MSSDSTPIIISSDSDIEDAMSSTIPIHAPTQAPVQPAPSLPSLTHEEDTEAFYEDEEAPTPQDPAGVPPLVTRSPTESSSHTTPDSTFSPLLFPRRKTIVGARKSVVRPTTTIQITAHPTLPSPPTIPTTIPTTTTSCLPPKKRARFTSPTPSPTDTTTTPPPPTRFHIGETSRAAAARAPTALTLDAQLGEQQVQIDGLSYRIDGLRYRLDGEVETRLGEAEEQIEGLIQGRVSIDLSHQGLWDQQRENLELIDQLRDELPEIRDRAEMTQEAQGRQGQELTSLRQRVTDVESREDALQRTVEQLREMIVIMDREIRLLRGGPGGSGAPGGA